MAIPRIVNRYELQEKLGEGGMGAVYRAYDRLDQSLVALKQVNTPLHDLQFKSQTSFGNSRMAMIQEFRTLASLRHPQIISVLDYGFDHEQNPFFTMTLLKNGKTLVEHSKGKSDAEKARLLVQTLQALIYLHRRDILHRDLKPANVLVTGDEQLKVLDFGLSATTSVQTQGTVGTLAYMASEVLLEQPATRESDLYSVGMIAYELFAGTYPFKAPNPIRLIRQIIQTMPDFSLIENPQLEAVLMRWLIKDPDDRFQSAEDIIEALCEAVDIDPPQESTAIRESFLQASQFIGREAELHTLKDGLDGAIAGGNAFYLVGGESGAGKSRLMDELRISALVSGATVLRGQAVDGGGLPFQLWRNIVRRLILMVDVDDLQASIIKDIVPDIADLLGQDVADAPQLTGAEYQNRLVITIMTLLKRYQQPLLILLEDMQWATEGLLLFQNMAQTWQQMPSVMIVGTYRNDERPHLVEELSNFEVIDLHRLSRERIAELSTAMLGDIGRDEALIDLLETQTEGNTFFMVEVVRSLAEEAGRLADVGTIKLPENIYTSGIEQIIQRRLAKVPAQYQRLLEIMAVLGRYIDLNLVDYLTEQATITSEKWLHATADASVIEIADEQWRFAHDKLREGVLHAIDDAQIPTIHAQAAQAIETIYPQQVDYAPQLIQLWRKAEQPAKELEYIAVEGKKLVDLAGFQNFQTAKDLYERAFDILPSADASQALELNITTHRGVTYLGLHQLDDAIPFLERAIALSNTLGENYYGAHALVGLARAKMATSSKSDVLALVDAGIKKATSTQDYRLRASVYGLRGYIFAYYNDFTGALNDFVDANEALKVAKLEADRAIMLNNIGKLQQVTGEFEEARANLNQARDIALRVGHFNTAVLSTSNLGITAYFSGEYDEAAAYFRQSIQLMNDTGDIAGLSHVWVLCAYAEAERGDKIALCDCLLQAIAQRQEATHHYSNIYLLMGGALFSVLRGANQQAVDWCALAEKAGGIDPFILEWITPLKAKINTAAGGADLKTTPADDSESDLDGVVDALKIQLAEYRDTYPDKP